MRCKIGIWGLTGLVELPIIVIQVCRVVFRARTSVVGNRTLAPILSHYSDHRTVVSLRSIGSYWDIARLWCRVEISLRDDHRWFRITWDYNLTSKIAQIIINKGCALRVVCISLPGVSSLNLFEVHGTSRSGSVEFCRHRREALGVNYLSRVIWN